MSSASAGVLAAPIVSVTRVEWGSGRSRCLALERLYQPTHVGFDLNLVELQRVNFLGNVPNWWQAISLHVRAGCVVQRHDRTPTVPQLRSDIVGILGLDAS